MAVTRKLADIKMQPTLPNYGLKKVQDYIESFGTLQFEGVSKETADLFAQNDLTRTLIFILNVSTKQTSSPKSTSFGFYIQEVLYINGIGEDGTPEKGAESRTIFDIYRFVRFYYPAIDAFHNGFGLGLVYEQLLFLVKSRVLKTFTCLNIGKRVYVLSPFFGGYYTNCQDHDEFGISLKDFIQEANLSNNVEGQWYNQLITEFYKIEDEGNPTEEAGITTCDKSLV